MRFFSRLRDRLTDRRPTIRRSRSRRRRPWRLLLLLLAVVLLIAGLLVWSEANRPPSGQVVVISTTASGELRLDGRPISLAELERELVALKAGPKPLVVAIAGPSVTSPPATPSPEVAALLERLRLNWMSAPQVGLAVLPPEDKGGDHGR